MLNLKTLAFFGYVLLLSPLISVGDENQPRPPRQISGGGGSSRITAPEIREILRTLQRCKETSDCKGKDEGCTKGTAEGVDVSHCFPCNATSKIKDAGLKVDGCDKTDIVLILAIAGGVSLLVGGAIVFTICLLVSSCPLYKYKQRINNERPGQRRPVSAGQKSRASVSASRAKPAASKTTNKTNQRPGGSGGSRGSVGGQRSKASPSSSIKPR